MREMMSDEEVKQQIGKDVLRAHNEMKTLRPRHKKSIRSMKTAEEWVAEHHQCELPAKGSGMYLHLIEQIKAIQQDAIQSSPDTVRLDLLQKNWHRITCSDSPPYRNQPSYWRIDGKYAGDTLRNAIDNAREKEKK